MNQTIDIPDGLKSIKKVLGIWAVALLSMASSCSHLSVSHYDKTTVDTLNSLKPEVTTVYDGFEKDPIDQAATGGLSAKFKSAVAYEQSKGEGNHDTVGQIQTIQSMYERHLKDRGSDGKWTKPYISDKKANILKAIDGAIQTENSKNRKE